MDAKKYMFIIKGEIKDDITSYNYNSNTKRMEITYSSGKIYPYSYNNVKILKEPKQTDPHNFRFIMSNGQILDNINEIYLFSSEYDSYLRFFFKTGYSRSFNSNELTIISNALSDKAVYGLFGYFKAAAQFNDLRTNDGKQILGSIYDKIDFVPSESVLASYLNGDAVKELTNDHAAIFPFGCNLSQITAVQNALSHNISIIEGPPGTGKTQTILNIIANIICKGKNVMVVSNNNSATDNVFEKLQKYGYGFIAAQMGNRDNKSDFIKNKQMRYPDFNDYPPEVDEPALEAMIRNTTNEIISLFEKQNRLANIKREQSELELEQKYYLDYFNSHFDDLRIFKRNDLNSDKLLELWNEIQQINENDKKLGFFRKLIYKIRYSLGRTDILVNDTEKAIAVIKKVYYEHKAAELKDESENIEASLNSNGMEPLLRKLTALSDSMFRYKLRKRYNNSEPRIEFDEKYWKDPARFIQEYPVLLSTTFSSRSCFKDIFYDYVIVDEASQVDLACGVLAMSCARNMVIVGDTKQLPNVITDKDRAVLTPLSEKNNIPVEYRCEEHSLLSSACEVFQNAPRTLLREHYRCHPKIIDFCNKKFYNDRLIIMTKDNGESDVLKAYITPSGNHARGHFNQRQVDLIIKDILPELSSDDVGIIAPYNAQTKVLANEITDQIPISTVHKFQGRENDDIIISTVDNEITEFTDNPNMLNVAVSRAKNRLRIVVSDNENNRNTNIGELVRYIQYNNFEIQKSELYSVFDMLYKGYEQKRREYLKKHKRISEYDSENLMNALIEDILKEECFSKLDVVSHFPLNNIIRDMHLLNADEIRYASNPWTHIDFVIFNRIDKVPVLAIEVDGYMYHKEGTRQHERDAMKNTILEKYRIPLLRFNTTGSGEKERLENSLRSALDL